MPFRGLRDARYQHEDSMNILHKMNRAHRTEHSQIHHNFSKGKVVFEDLKAQCFSHVILANAMRESSSLVRAKESRNQIRHSACHRKPTGTQIAW